MTSIPTNIDVYQQILMIMYIQILIQVYQQILMIIIPTNIDDKYTKKVYWWQVYQQILMTSIPTNIDDKYINKY